MSGVEVLYTVTVRKGGLEAYLTVTPSHGVEIGASDSPPTKDVTVSAAKPNMPAEPSLSDAVAAVRAKGIVVDIDLEACHKACTELLGQPVLIARGEPPTPGKDAYIEFHTPLEKVVYLPSEADRVDFREVIKMPDIRAGEIIASKVNMELGTPGQTVTGEPILPPRPKDAPLRAGKGVEIKQEGERMAAFAAISGRPDYNERSGIVSVDPLVIHRGDVDLSSGNVRSSGSLLIQGQVTENMVVESEGSLEVSGAVTEATARAWGSVKLRGNVFKSCVSAGKDASWVQRLNQALRNLEQTLEFILNIQEHLKLAQSGPSENGLSRAAARELLDDVYYVHFRKAVGMLLTLLKEDLSPMPAEVSKSLLETNELLVGARPVLFDRVRAILERVSSALVWTGEELQKGESDILVPYVQGSVLEASRDILVTGPGALYCTLTAGRQIRIQGSPGLFRGGTARARQLIRVNQAGGQGSAVTVLEVSASGKIQAQTVLPDTVLCVGRVRYKADSSLHNVTASLMDGRMSVNSDSGVFWV